MQEEESFSQLHLKFTDPIQYDYEVIRPVVLFSQSVNSRSQETEVPRTTVREKAKQFVIEGMLGLADQRAAAAGNREIGFPDPIAKHILYLKHLYPPIHYREIVRIIGNKFGYQTDHHKVKRFLERHPVTVQLELELTYFHDFEDAYEARWTVVRMFYEGWNKKSIADVLRLSRQHVTASFRRLRKTASTRWRTSARGLKTIRTTRCRCPSWTKCFVPSWSIQMPAASAYMACWSRKWEKTRPVSVPWDERWPTTVSGVGRLIL